MYFFVGVQDIHYNENLLLEQLEICADTLEKAERFELLGHLYRLIVPMYEERRNYEALANSYSHLAQAYNKIVEVTRSGKRLLGRFYRVAFFGMVRDIYLVNNYILIYNSKVSYVYVRIEFDLLSKRYEMFTYIISSRHILRRRMVKNIFTRNPK